MVLMWTAPSQLKVYLRIILSAVVPCGSFSARLSYGLTFTLAVGVVRLARAPVLALGTDSARSGRLHSG